MEGFESAGGNGAVVFAFDRPFYSQGDRRRLHDWVEGTLSPDARHVVVDCTRAPWFGAPILDELLDIDRRLSAWGGDVRLVTTSSKIARILKAACVDRLKTYSSVQCALAEGPSIHAAA